MPGSSSTIIIALGTPTVVTPSLTILDIGIAGDVSAKRTLTHPDSANFAPIAYYRNPSFTTNFDAEVLVSPLARVQLTSTSSKLIRQEGKLEDVVVEETWGAQQGRVAAMPGYMLRELIQYLINPPAFSATAQTYIEWAPRDRSSKVYNVELYSVTVGSGSGEKVFTITDVRQLPNPSADIASPLDTMDVSPTSLVDQAVKVSLRIVSEVTA